MFTVDLFLNDGFLGDNQQVLGIKAQFVQQYQSVAFTESQDNHPATIEQLSKTFEDAGSTDQQHVFILSGNHGFEFIQKNPNIQNIIAQKKPIVIWVGHQDPGLASIEQYLNIVALPEYILNTQPELPTLFQNRCVSMQSVPNTLTAEALLTVKETWNRTYPQEKIELNPSNEYIGIFLGGDAPMADGTHLYWDEKAAYELGHAFGLMAMAQKKPQYLLITNGPRTGKFYPDSPNPKAPMLRQYKDRRWLPIAEALTQMDPNFASHAPSSPLDPVSAAFLLGLRNSGIPDGQYQFFDFKSGKPPKSAYKAMIAALRELPTNAIAVYSGESISYAEIRGFIPKTYAFKTNNMNPGHHAALAQFQASGAIKELDFTKPLNAQSQPKTQIAIPVSARATEDAYNIVRRFSELLKPDQISQKTFMPLQSQSTVLPDNRPQSPRSPKMPKVQQLT